MREATIGGAGQDPLVGRAVRLFEFLGRTQQLKNQPPRTADGYRSVLWLDNVPDHPAVVSTHRGEPEPDADILTVERVTRAEPPAPPAELLPWLSGDWHDSTARPALSGDLDAEVFPTVPERFAEWRAEWSLWSAQEKTDRPVRSCYSQLFAAYVAANGNPEELELVLGVGCLAWTPPGHEPVSRHVVTAPVGIRFDDDTGRLTVHRVESVATADVELDMLDPGLVPNPKHINDIRAQARELETHPLRRAETGALVRRVVHTLDANGEYRDEDAAPAPEPTAVAAYAPAVILRRRSQQGLVEIFETIVDQLSEAGDVPDGLRPLVDPDHRTRAHRESTSDGALVEVDGDTFLPLPVNDTQLRIVRQVDTQAQTLVQGPPGTGKTHTAAALLSHLLAQGKRVLVTAHTDRALREVRDKLPTEIKPLSVAVVGSSREDMSDLKVAVERIAAAATEHDEDAAADTVRRCLAAVEALGLRRADLHAELVAARQRRGARAHPRRLHRHAGRDRVAAECPGAEVRLAARPRRGARRQRSPADHGRSPGMARTPDRRGAARGRGGGGAAARRAGHRTRAAGVRRVRRHRAGRRRDRGPAREPQAAPGVRGGPRGRARRPRAAAAAAVGAGRRGGRPRAPPGDVDDRGAGRRPVRPRPALAGAGRPDQPARRAGRRPRRAARPAHRGRGHRQRQPVGAAGEAAARAPRRRHAEDRRRTGCPRSARSPRSR